MKKKLVVLGMLFGLTFCMQPVFAAEAAALGVGVEQDAVYSVTVTFDANGGSGVMNSLTAASNVSTSLTSNVFTRSGFTFTGWNTAADGTGTAYADMAVLMKNVSTYQKTKPVYDAYRKAKNKEKYRAGQERAIILHEAAARSLKAAGVVKLPNLDALQAEYEKLQTQKEALYADYGKLKKQVREYDVIKQNIDSILQAEKQSEREKETERG